nr:tape measure protein [Burkholderiaceae bacterium]
MTTGIGIRIRVEGAPEASAQLGQVDASVRRVGSSAGQSTTGTDNLAQSFGRLRQQAVGLVGAIGAGVLAREFIAQADAMTLLDARLRNAVGTGKAFTQAQRDIFEIAQANNVGLRETAQLYTRLAAPVQRLGGTVREVSGITDAFALALRVGGASAQEAASATLQFAQAMGSGRLQGDEFRSMAEASPRFLQALADGMGQPIEKLKEMGAEGKLTADVVGNALLKALAQLREEAEGLPDTVGGALTRLQNEALLAVVAFNEMTGAAGLVAETVGMGAEWIVKMTSAVRGLDADTRGLSGTVDLAAVGFGALGTILETVVLIGSDVAFVLKGIGREIGGIAAQAAAVLRGDFEAAGAIRREMIADAEQARAALDKFQASVSGATRGILAQRSALRENSLSAAENSNELARLSKHAGAADTAFRKLRSSVADDAKESKEAAKAKAKAVKDLADTLRDYESVRAKELEANAKSIEGLDKELQGLRDRYVETTAGKQVLDDLVNVRIEDAAATHEQMAAMMALAGENELAIAQQRVMAEKLREQIALRKAIATAVAGKEADEANARAAQAAATDWQRTADQIGQSLSDALMQGGKSASEYIAGLFRTMVLRPIIQAIVSPVAGAVAGAMGFAGPAQAAGGGIGSLASLGSAIGAFGGAFGTGMAYGGASGLVGGLSGAGALLGAGNVSMGLGAAAGALGPYALAAMAAYSLFKHKPTHHMGSVVGVDAAGAANSLWGDPSRIMDHYSGETDAALRGLGVSAAGVLNQLSG